MRISLFIVLPIFLVFSCTTDKSEEGSLSWSEADAFHEILANTYHPMEEGEIQEVYSNAGELAQKAREWHNSEFPEEYDNTEFRNELFSLVVESESLVELVDSETEEDSIVAVVNSIHDRFHALEDKMVHETKEVTDQ